MIDKMKLLLGISGAESDELLQYVLDATVDMVKGYCNIDEIPTPLEKVIVRMAVDMWRIEGYGVTGGTGNMEVKQIKRGDVTTSFEAVGVNSDDFIKAYTKQLNEYRKLRW